jgi:hypothetical protein
MKVLKPLAVKKYQAVLLVDFKPYLSDNEYEWCKDVFPSLYEDSPIITIELLEQELVIQADMFQEDTNSGQLENEQDTLEKRQATIKSILNNIKDYGISIILITKNQ